jgi:hypothetical protein
MDRVQAEQFLEKLCTDYQNWKEKYTKRQNVLKEKIEMSDLSLVKERENLLYLQAENMVFYGWVQSYERIIQEFLYTYNHNLPEDSEEELSLPSNLRFESTLYSFSVDEEEELDMMKQMPLFNTIFMEKENKKIDK